MLVKTFQAVSMSEAIQMVKAEMGPDAMIISSRKERRKGILGYFRKPLFEITATVDASSRPRRESVNPYFQQKEEGASTREVFQKSMLEPLVRELRELKERVDSVIPRKAATNANGASAPVKSEFVPDNGGEATGPATVTNGRPDMDKIRKFLMERVSANKPDLSAVAETLPAAGTSTVAAVEEKEKGLESAPVNGWLSARLEKTGLGPEFCEKLLASAGSVPAEDEPAAMTAAMETLAGMIKCAGTVRMKKNGPRIIALVGPTGVGKTTTVAKLAAMYVLKRKVKVALVTTDIFRAGAVEQLKTYAGVLRVQMETASTKKELEKALSNHSDKDIILIDTAGKSARDCGKIDELSELLSGDTGIEKHLCLSATTRDEDLQDIVDQFRRLAINRVLFTKLDESGRLGCVVNIPLRNGFPLSYVTNGQRVPEDIETASGKKIAHMVLGAFE